jgi:hypothetical protein
MHPCTCANHHFLLTTPPSTPLAIIILLTTQAQTTSSRLARSTAIPHPPYQRETNPSHTARTRTHHNHRGDGQHDTRPGHCSLISATALQKAASNTTQAQRIRRYLPTYLATTLFASPLLSSTQIEPRPEKRKREREPLRLPGWFSSPIISPSFVCSFVRS